MVTLLTRPWCFGKTLNMSMVKQFFCVIHRQRRGLFWEACDMGRGGVPEASGDFSGDRIELCGCERKCFPRDEDEYDTPMQEAYVHEYWEKRTGFIRGLFNFTFKTNPLLELKEIPAEKDRKYGYAFEGKTILVGSGF